MPLQRSEAIKCEVVALAIWICHVLFVVFQIALIGSNSLATMLRCLILLLFCNLQVCLDAEDQGTIILSATDPTIDGTERREVSIVKLSLHYRVCLVRMWM